MAVAKRRNMRPSLVALVALPLAAALALMAISRATPASAHVKIFFMPEEMPIRNAATSSMDGAFSQGGVCGGAQNWGETGWASVVNGQTVCARVNYNGGHQAPQNKFRALFLCGQGVYQGQVQVQNAQQVPFVAGTNPPPDPGMMTVSANVSNEGMWNGYTLCVELPFQQVTGSPIQGNLDRTCTLSFTDQRNWGGCLDMVVYDAGEVAVLTGKPTLSPTSPELYAPIYIPQAEAMYAISLCDTSSGGPCCLNGYVGVSRYGLASARLVGSSGWSACYNIYSNGWQDYQMVLLRQIFDNDTYQGYFFSARRSPLSAPASARPDSRRAVNAGFDGVNYNYPPDNITLTVVVSESAATAFLTNTGVQAPLVADHSLVVFSTLDTGVADNYVPMPTGVDPTPTPWYIIVGVVLGALTLYLVGGVLLNRYFGEKKWRHPHIHLLLVQCGCVRRDRKLAAGEQPESKGALARSPRPALAPTHARPTGFLVQLPAGWYAAIDTASGEPYYFNATTKEVTWERPRAYGG